MRTIATIDSTLCCVERDLRAATDADNIVTDATTARTLSLADAGQYLRFTNAGAITVTVPADAVTNFPVGTQIVLRRTTGAGAVTLAGTPTVNGDASGSVAADGTFALKKVAADEWDFI